MGEHARGSHVAAIQRAAELLSALEAEVAANGVPDLGAGLEVERTLAAVRQQIDPALAVVAGRERAARSTHAGQA